jgi:hypothetical protein
MMHDRADTSDALPRIFCFSIPDPPVQPLDFRDDHGLRLHSRGIAGRERAGDLLKMLESHSDMKPIENRRFSDACIGENAPKSRTTIGEAVNSVSSVRPTASRFRRPARRRVLVLPRQTIMRISERPARKR